MMRFAPLFVRSGLVLVAALGVTESAYAVAPPSNEQALPRANECEADADCGHGFECQTSITSLFGGGSDVPGSAGTGSGGAAGAGSAGAPGTGGTTGAAPVAPRTCGNGLCELPENPESCPTDCVVYRYCALAECESPSDCAEGYTCQETGSVGTGGGPSAPVCGDGVCNGGPESATTCPEDCESRSYCTPESGYCTSDSDCVAGFYCSFYGSGSGGSPGTGGLGAGAAAGTGTAGTASSSTGGAGGVSGAASVGGSAGSAEPGGAGGAGGYAGTAGYAGNEGEAPPDSGDVAVQGTCMPGGGIGGTAGTGGVSGSGGVSQGGLGGTIGTGAVSGSGGSGNSAGTSEGGSTGGTGSGGVPGSGAQSGSTANGGRGAEAPVSGESGDEGKPTDDVVVTRGCSVTQGAEPSAFGSLAFAALALAGLRRRRARA